MDWLRRLLALLFGGRGSSFVDDDRNEWQGTRAQSEDLRVEPEPMNVSGSPDDRDEASAGSNGRDEPNDGGDDGGDDGGGDGGDDGDGDD